MSLADYALYSLPHNTMRLGLLGDFGIQIRDQCSTRLNNLGCYMTFYNLKKSRHFRLIKTLRVYILEPYWMKKYTFLRGYVHTLILSPYSFLMYEWFEFGLHKLIDFLDPVEVIVKSEFYYDIEHPGYEAFYYWQYFRTRCIMYPNDKQTVMKGRATFWQLKITKFVHMPSIRAWREKRKAWRKICGGGGVVF